MRVKHWGGGKVVKAYKAAISWILGHADNVAETPCENLTIRAILKGRLKALADAEGLDHAPSGRLLGGGCVDVGLRTASHQNSVRAPFGDGDGPSRVRSRVGHARYDLLALSDLAGAGIVCVCRHAGKVGGEEHLAVGAERDAVVRLKPTCSSALVAPERGGMLSYRSADNLRVGLNADNISLLLQH